MPINGVLKVADTITVSAHKVGGLKGLAVLVWRRPEQLRAQMLGGTALEFLNVEAERFVAPADRTEEREA